MASYAHLNLIVNKNELREKINNLIHLDNLQGRLSRIEMALDSSSIGERFERLSWSCQYNFLSFGTPKYKSEDDFFNAVEKGDPIHDGDAVLQIGKQDSNLPENGQLYITLSFYDRFGKNVIHTREEIFIKISPPTLGRTFQQDQNAIRPIIGLVIEVIQPNFGFSYIDNNPILDKLLLSNTYNPPWHYYWDTLVYGPELVNNLGLERLRTIPAFRNIELEGPMIWLSSPRGMNDELFFSHQGKDISYSDGALKKLFLRACKEHEEAVKSSLNLKSTV